MNWTCYICGRERPDARISVFKIDLRFDYGLPEGAMQQNIRYCNDNPDCTEKAEKKQ